MNDVSRQLHYPVDWLSVRHVISTGNVYFRLNLLSYQPALHTHSAAGIRSGPRSRSELPLYSKNRQHMIVLSARIHCVN
jgi:hypothetical protein